MKASPHTAIFYGKTLKSDPTVAAFEAYRTDRLHYASGLVRQVFRQLNIRWRQGGACASMPRTLKALGRQPAIKDGFPLMILVGKFQKIRRVRRRYPLRGSKNRF